ncbi:unnamed protein product [Eruca vesicaria subsp. sativa]|uniref:Uncharacterized protein n=1 Tax=Eruca vesicaria subsp. sativa TaxID=29727 RepID=A0ABC8M6K7_ERUVS|nr:unnamed protein product [Eruca vesicaria subsp. sativa]
MRSWGVDYLKYLPRLNHPRERVEMDILIGETDNYDGVTVTLEEPMDAEVFTLRLLFSIGNKRNCLDIITQSLST